MANQLTLKLLGAAQILLDGEPLSGLVAAKQRALIFHLAVTQRTHTRDALATLLWPNLVLADAKTNLRQALTALRKQLPDHLVVTRTTVSLHPEASLSVDVIDFAAFAQQGQAGDINLLQAAAKLYPGEFLAGFFVSNAHHFEEWMVLLREQYHLLALQTLHALADHAVRRRDVTDGLHYVSRLLALEPWREESHQQMMRLLAWDGQFMAALAQYQQCQQLLEDAFGVEPTPETTQLYRRIRAAREAKQGQLPTPVAPFVTREEVAEINSLLHNPDCRLLTIVGMGGAGKTRLALQVATQQAPLYLDGIYFVELAGSTDAAQMTVAIANAVGLTFRGTQTATDQLADYLRDKEILLILDNFEHLLHQDSPLSESSAYLPGGDAVTLVMQLLTKASDLKVLLTSRERLKCQGEQVFVLRGLPYPKNCGVPELDQYASIQLFQQEARRVAHSFCVMQEVGAVVEICRLVQGLPLAIKLAAALVKGQSTQQIAQALATDLDTLSSRLRNIPPRHRSLRVTFDYTWRRLSLDEQRLLAQLALWRSGFDQDAAQQITGATTTILSSLADKSLLTVDTMGRYELHPLLREFVAKTLSPTDLSTLQIRYSSYYLHFVGTLAVEMQSAQSKAVLEQIQHNLGNIRQAWRWAVAHDQSEQIGIALTGLTHYYVLTGSTQEGMQLLQQVIEYITSRFSEETLPTTQRELLIQLLIALATLRLEQGPSPAAVADLEHALRLVTPAHRTAQSTAYLQWGRGLRIAGDLVAAVPKLQKALALAVDDEWLVGEATANQELGEVYRLMGQLDRAERLAHQALTVACATSQRYLESTCLELLGTTLYTLGNYEIAWQHCDVALQIMREVGDRRGESRVLNTMALLSGWSGKFVQAQQLAEASLQIDRQLGDQSHTATKLNNLGLQAMNMGNPVDARRYYEEALAINRAFQDRLGEGVVLGNLGDVAMSMGEFARAEHYFETALALRRKIHDQRGEAWMLCSRSLLEGKREKFAEAIFYAENALEVIAGTGERSKAGYAQAHLGHGYAGLGRYQEAIHAYETSLSIRRVLGQEHTLVIPTVGLAEVALAQKDLAAALRFAEAGLAYLEQGHLGGTRESGRAEWACYHVLQTLGDPRAHQILTMAVTRIQTIADRIQSKTQRHAYLYQVIAHRRLMVAWQQTTQESLASFDKPPRADDAWRHRGETDGAVLHLQCC